MQFGDTCLNEVKGFGGKAPEQVATGGDILPRVLPVQIEPYALIRRHIEQAPLRLTACEENVGISPGREQPDGTGRIPRAEYHE